MQLSNLAAHCVSEMHLTPFPLLPSPSCTQATPQSSTLTSSNPAAATLTIEEGSLKLLLKLFDGQ